MSPVHYLVADPARGDLLVYPSEIVDPDHQGMGSMFVETGPGGALDDAYEIDAIHGDEDMVVTLKRTPDGRTYLATIAGLGDFAFRVTHTGERRYWGGIPGGPNRALTSIVPVDHQLLEAACVLDDLTFTGRTLRPDT